MGALDVLSQETLENIKKAQTQGILASTGLEGIDLSGAVAQIPVNVPCRNNTSAFPRKIAGMGSEIARWRALLNINSKQTSAAIGFDKAGTLAKILVQNVFAAYKPVAKGGRVTLDAVSFGRNYVDVLAEDTLQTLNQVFLAQDMLMINGQNWALGATATPTLELKTNGGTIAESKKVSVKCAPRSGANYFDTFGEGEEEVTLKSHAGIASTAANTAETSGSTNSVVAKVAAVKGAVAYDWYVGEEGGTLHYYTTTTVAQVTIKTIPTTAEELPNLPLLSAGTPSATPPTEDKSNSANYYNGILASTLGAYGETGVVKPGTGENESGATWIDYGAAAMSGEGGSITILDELFAEIWATVQLSPSALMVNSQQAEDITTLLLGSSAALTLLPATDAAARTNLAGGGNIGSYVNHSAGGNQVSIEVHPRVPPGTIIARTDRVPYPGSNIGTAFEMAMQYDTMQFDYAAAREVGVVGGGPRYDFEVRSMETMKNYAPAAQAIACNVGRAA